MSSIVLWALGEDTKMLSHQRIAINEIKELLAQEQIKLITDEAAIDAIFAVLEKLYRNIADDEAQQNNEAEPTRITRREEDELFEDLIGSRDIDARL